MTSFMTGEGIEDLVGEHRPRSAQLVGEVFVVERHGGRDLVVSRSSSNGYFLPVPLTQTDLLTREVAFALLSIATVSSWVEADEDEREALAQAAHQQLNRLNGHYVGLDFVELNGPGAFANYAHDERLIRVRTTRLFINDPGVTFGTLVHEHRHARQEHYIELGMSDPEVDLWRAAKASYDVDKQTDVGYRYNALEVDAYVEQQRVLATYFQQMRQEP